MGEELYELPKGWVWVKLGEVLEVIRGASPRPKGDPRFFGGSIPWIMISDINKEKGKFISKTRDTVTEAGANKSRYLKAGTLILSNSGTVCVPKLMAVDGCIHDGFVAFPEFPNELNILYFYYFFEYIRPQIIQENRQGITQVNLNTEIVKDINIRLAPFSEQYRIVAKIEELFTELDAGVELLKKLKVKLKRYRQAVLKSAVEGSLTQEWREANQDKLEPASILLERILKQRREKWEAEQLAKMTAQGKTPKDDSWKQKYKEPIAPDTSDLPELPDGWVWVNLGQITWSVKDGPHYSPKYVNEGIPFITGGNVRPSGVDFANAKRITPELYTELSKKCKPEKGDILYTKGGTTGIARVNTYDIEFNVWVHVAVLKLAGLVEPFYIQHSLNSPFCYSQSQHFTHGVGNQDLGLTRMIKIVLSLPPQDEQKKIIDEIEYLYSVIDQLEKTIDANLKRAEKLRQSILKQAFQGKLVPQDPNDEPAEKLLERIKAEKAKQTTTKTKRKTKSKKQSDLQLEIPLK